MGAPPGLGTGQSSISSTHEIRCIDEDFQGRVLVILRATVLSTIQARNIVACKYSRLNVNRVQLVVFLWFDYNPSSEDMSALSVSHKGYQYV